MVKWSAAVLVAGLLLAAPEARAGDGAEAKAAFDTASNFFALEEFSAALPYFRKAYDLSEHRPAATFGLAQCLRSLKMYGEAIEKFEEYLRSDPPDKVEVTKTVKLLKEVQRVEAKRKQEEAAAEAATAAERKKAEDKIRAEVEAEAKAKYEAEARIRAEEQKKADQRRRADLAAVPNGAPPPPSLVTTPAAEEDDGGVLSSPVFWIVTGLVIAGGAAAGVYFGTRSELNGYGGSTDVLLEY